MNHSEIPTRSAPLSRASRRSRSVKTGPRATSLIHHQLDRLNITALYLTQRVVHRVPSAATRDACDVDLPEIRQVPPRIGTFGFWVVND